MPGESKKNAHTFALRPVAFDDGELLLKWRNDPVTRENSFDTREVRLEDHMRWFEQAICDKDIAMYIMEVDDVPVGQIRLNYEKCLDGTRGRISYSIEPNCRGLGYGAKILAMVEDFARLNGIADYLYGEVREENIPSRKAFLHNGYDEMKTEDHMEYRKSTSW